MRRQKRDIRTNQRIEQWTERMREAGASIRQIGFRLGDVEGGERRWGPKIQRWASTAKDEEGQPKWGVPPRREVEDVVERLEIRDAKDLVQWFYLERAQPPSWMLDAKASPWVEAAATRVMVADPQQVGRVVGGQATGTDGRASSAFVPAAPIAIGAVTYAKACGAVELLELAAVKRPQDAEVQGALAILRELLPSLGKFHSSWTTGNGNARGAAKKALDLVVLRGGSYSEVERRVCVC